MVDPVALRPTMQGVPGLLTLERTEWEQRLPFKGMRVAQCHVALESLAPTLRHPKLLWQQWEEQHVGLTEHADTQAAKVRGKCFLQGICTCQGRGLKILKVHQRFQQTLQSSMEKDDLQDGLAAVEVWQEGDDIEEKQLLFFSHIALQYLKPLVSVGLALVPADLIPPQKRGNKMMKVNFDIGWQIVLHKFEQVDFRKRIKMAVWRLWDSPLHINRIFDGVHVEIFQLPGSEALLWNGKDERPIRGHRVQHEGGVQADRNIQAEDNENHHAGEDAGDFQGVQSEDSLDEVLGEVFDVGVARAFAQAGSQASSTTSSASTSSSSSSSSSSGETQAEEVVEEEAPLAPAGSADEPVVVAEVGARPLVPAVGRHMLEALPVFLDGAAMPGVLIRKHGTSNDVFVYCNNPAHNIQKKCSLTRTLNEGRRPQQGRPLGCLAAWAQRSGEYPDKESHMAFKPSLAQRTAARNAFRVHPLAAQFEAWERPLRPGEPVEPEQCP